MTAASSVVLAFLLGFAASAETLTEEGVAAFSRGEYSSAAEKLTKALEAKPSDQQARAFLALTRAATGHCDDAVSDLGASFQSARDATLKKFAGLGLVQCAVTKGRIAEALPVITELQQIFPDDADVLYESARVHMKAFNDATYAMFQKTPSSYRVNQLSAEIFETQGKYTEAITEYRKAIEKNPRAIDLHYRLGRAILLEAHGPDAMDSARKEFEAELAVNPSDAAAEFQLGQIATVQGRPQEARQRFERALQLGGDFPEASLAIAKMDIQAKQYEKAIPLLESVVKKQPKNEAAHYNLMLAYRNAGMTDRAKAEQQVLQRLQQPPEGEFTDFLKKLGEKPPEK